VTFDHMDIALSKAFKSAVVDSILCLPQHQQVKCRTLQNVECPELCYSFSSDPLFH